MLLWGSMLPLVGSGIGFRKLLSLRSLLGFSGSAEKVEYGFEDIGPHGKPNSRGWNPILTIIMTRLGVYYVVDVLAFLNVEIIIVLIAFLFGSLSAFAIHYIFGGGLFRSGLDLLLDPICQPSTPQEFELNQAYRVPYTGFHYLDVYLCILVSFFQPAIHPYPHPVLVYFLGTHAPLVITPMIEGRRERSHPLISFPSVTWGVYQVVTIGVGVPWYWLVFILTGSHHRAGKDATISQVQAEAIVFSFFFGSLVPFFAMVYFDSIYATAFWQPFPLWLSMAEQIYLYFVRKPTSAAHANNSYQIIQTLNFLVLVSSSIVHLTIATSVWGIRGIKEGDHGLLRKGVAEFLTTDITFGFGVSLLATLWLGKDLKEIILLAIWSVVGGVMLGPGAALAGTAMWREHKLRIIT